VRGEATHPTPPTQLKTNFSTFNSPLSHSSLSLHIFRSMLESIEDWDAASDRNVGIAKRPRERESAPDELPIISEPLAHGDRYWWHATENGARHREWLAVKPLPSSAVAESSKSLPEPSGPLGDESTHHWVSVHDSAGLWALAQQIGAAESMPVHPDVQPAPPGSLDLPAPVLTFAAQDESAAAREAADLDRAHMLNESLLRACWPPRCRIPSGRALTSSADTISGWAKLKATLSRRLVVVCGASFASMSEHPTVVEHMSLLVLVTALSDEACAARCGCDSLADLWDAMVEGCPLIFLEAPCSTRRARKQLLYKLSKQCVAVEYAWEALIGPMADALENASMPALEEGWAAVLQ